MPAQFTSELGIKLDPEIDVAEDYYFPANYPQIQRLIGKMLTHIDALGLPEGQSKATKDLVKQSISQWWSDVQENSCTSYRGCLGPIEIQRASNGTEAAYVWVAAASNIVDGERAAVQVVR